MGPGDLSVLVPWPIPWSFYHLKVTCVFLTVAALRINWAEVICAKVVQVFGGCIQESQEKFLVQSYTHRCSVRPWCMRSCRKSLHVAFGRMHACHEVGGRPYLHKSPSGLSETCPSTRLPMERCSCMDRLSSVMWVHPKQSEIRRFCLQALPTHDIRRRGLRILLLEVCSRAGLGLKELQNGHLHHVLLEVIIFPGISKRLVLFLMCAVDMW